MEELACPSDSLPASVEGCQVPPHAHHVAVSTCLVLDTNLHDLPANTSLQSVCGQQADAR